MKQKTHSFKRLLFLIILCIPIITIGQNSDKNTITYESPSKGFIDITIQSYKGLPRFGDLYFHRGVTSPVNPNIYKELVKMKYLAAVYADIDKNKITKERGNNNDLKINNSMTAQRHLLQLVSKLGTEELLKKYFCDASNTTIPCTFTDTNGMRKHIGRWGNSSNEFQQMRSYKSVVKNHLDELQNWSKTFFKNNQETAYFVTQSMVVGKYDFKQKGYWIWGMGSGSFMIRKFQFTGYTDNEKKLLTQQKMFLAIHPAKAKEFKIQKMTPIFTVFKIKVMPKTNNITNVEYSFELDNKIIEIYKDKALTNKMGEINIDKTVFKY